MDYPTGSDRVPIIGKASATAKTRTARSIDQV